MRSILTAGALLFVAALVPAPVNAEQACDPNPLTQGHPGWMKISSAAVDLRTPPPASATDPLMQKHWRVAPAAAPDVGTAGSQSNPLTHQP